MSISMVFSPSALTLRCPEAGIREARPWKSDDTQKLQGYAAWYNEVVARKSRDGQYNKLLQIGETLYRWLDEENGFLARVSHIMTAPAIIEFQLPIGDYSAEEEKLAHAFLDAPWELLARDRQFWALRADRIFCPVRRIGEPDAPPPASENRLNIVFMAAAPRGADTLDYEAEEVGIIKATEGSKLDLTVEESGMLDLLADCVAHEKPDVVHISCHGVTQNSAPSLLFEDETGSPHRIDARTLVTGLASSRPRLLFLSACETARAAPALPSLTRALISSGTPAVAGWAASVRDSEASLFAGTLYQRLARGEKLEEAFAWSRFDLAEHEGLPESKDGSPRSRDWHLARLFLGRDGGGSLATAGGKPRRAPGGYAMRAFLDEDDKQVPVAAASEFVGRRRQIQEILREFRKPIGERKTGICLHAIGRQGKSSLAARIAYRMEHSHKPIVIFGDYTASGIFRKVCKSLPDHAPENAHDCFEHLEKHPARLGAVLLELFRAYGKSVLLVIDDFEQAIKTEDCRTLRPECLPAIRSLLEVFREIQAETESNLLFTSRYRFTCPDEAGKDLAEKRLHFLSLDGMSKQERRKQAFAKQRVREAGAITESRLDDIIACSGGNPGLQSILMSLAMEAQETCDTCLQEMTAYLVDGKHPDSEELRNVFENLKLDKLLDLLTPVQRSLIRDATLFQVPVPPAALHSLLHDYNQGDIDRLLQLSLLEESESDIPTTSARPVAVNALVRPRVGQLDIPAQKRLASASLLVLFNAWGGEAQERTRPLMADFELTRLATLVQDVAILNVTASYVLNALHDAFEYKQAAAWAKEMLACFTNQSVEPEPHLCRIAATLLNVTGDVDEALPLLQKAHKTLETRGDMRSRAVALSDIARIMTAKGDVDKAMELLKEASDVFEGLGDMRSRAVALGDIARIMTDKGDVDKAMELLKEALAVFGGLGDMHSRAMTLADIARIMTDKGDVDKAMELLKEASDVFEVLGDMHSRAGALSEIARIMTDKGDVDKAMELLKEASDVFKGLGDMRSRAVALGGIARIMTDKGDIDKAMELQSERLTINEKLGDLDGIANASYDLAQIEQTQEKWQEMFDHLVTAYAILNKIGRLDGIAMVGLDLGQLLCASGNCEQGVEILTRSRDGFLKLGLTQHSEFTQKIIDRFSAHPQEE